MITANGTSIKIDGEPSDILTEFSSICAALMICFDVSPDTLEEGIWMAVDTIEKIQRKDDKERRELRKWLKEVEKKVAQKNKGTTDTAES